ncbi:30S ribosome-binding factor RbfA [Enorma phocaeensis]|uniref:30S ribosome-binding factor RbfA n=1 Tax=Enorma phocaeensis TaxID=1871019 RepID=UPI000C81BDC9|nr:30S ribosome-binding factor RbfA [Enorma phocaeensis]
MKQNNVTRRLSEQLREKLGYILLFEIADPRLELVTLTGVEVTQDRSYARIFVSCDGERYDEVLETLASAKGRIRSLLARSLDWRIVPELDFRIDTSTDEAQRIAAALENVPPTIGVEKDEDGYPVEVSQAIDAAGAGEAAELSDDAAVADAPVAHEDGGDLDG